MDNEYGNNSYYDSTPINDGEKENSNGAYNSNFNSAYNTGSNYQNNQTDLTNINGEDYTPISPLGYLGYWIVFSIPCVGFILMLVFSFGGTRNVNVKNMSRGLLIMSVITVILTIFLIFALALIGRSHYTPSHYSY